MDQRKLYRSRSNKMIAGVCGGIADYFGIDPTLVRIAAVALLLLGFGTVGLIYLVMMIVVPEEPLSGTPSQGTKGGTAGDDPMAPPPPPAPEQPVASPASEAPGSYQPYQPPPAPVEPHRHRSPGATAGLVLIVIGALFLAGQFVPALAWWNLWPLIIVIAGVVQAVTPGRDGWSVARLFDGLVTIAWGLLFLAITMGFVTWGVFAVLLSLWPVLLIAIGFEILGKALHSTWIRALGSLAIIGALAWAVAVSASGSTVSIFAPTGGGESASISQPAGSVDEARLDLDAAAGTVILRSGTELVNAEGESPWGRPDFSVETDGDTAEVVLNSGDTDGAVWWPGRSGSRIEAELSDEVLWDVDVSVGAADFKADLSDVQVRSFKLQPGVASCELKLGDAPNDVGEATVNIEAGISSIKIEVPKGAQVRVESESGLTGHDIDAALESVDTATWQTAGFDEAHNDGEDVWIIKVESGIGSIQLDTY